MGSNTVFVRDKEKEWECEREREREKLRGIIEKHGRTFLKTIQQHHSPLHKYCCHACIKCIKLDYARMISFSSSIFILMATQACNCIRKFMLYKNLRQHLFWRLGNKWIKYKMMFDHKKEYNLGLFDKTKATGLYRHSDVTL